MVTHYIADMGVFGHVMGSSTVWGAEIHHSDYEDYVGARTTIYSSDFNAYLMFDGEPNFTLPYDGALALANDPPLIKEGYLHVQGWTNIITGAITSSERVAENL
jgi:hypothetical protein